MNTYILHHANMQYPISLTCWNDAHAIEAAFTDANRHNLEVSRIKRNGTVIYEKSEERKELSA